MKLIRLANYLAPRVIAWCEKRKPNFQVMRRADYSDPNAEEDVYLRRWWFIPRNQFFNIYFHNMIRDDDAALHDHPSWSLSLMLRGVLKERYQDDPERQRVQGVVKVRYIDAGAVTYRGLHFAHQLLVETEAWTIFITGPKIRLWGFWCPKGWRPWTKYVKTGQDASGRGTSTEGIGCGEV